MSSIAWLQLLMLGGLVGMLGQGIRVLVGLKKEWDSASRAGKTLASRFDAGRLVVSLLIGFAAGAVGTLTLAGMADVAALGARDVATLLATGYAGTDFIEGFIGRSDPRAGTARV
jgi:hypothetical protein